jgi:branched-chain amino acid transport system ATP-binding protein
LSALLEINGIDAFYGRVQALRGVTLAVDKQEVVALIGSNGAGKTTTLRTISGLMRPARGTIRFDGEDITELGAARIVGKGICQAPEGRRLFSRMSVYDNLMLGAYTRNDRAGIAQDMERVFELFPRLRERRTQVAGTLSGGEQQMLAIGRAMMSRPKVLMLDEPSLGLAPILVETIFGILAEIKSSGWKQARSSSRARARNCWRQRTSRKPTWACSRRLQCGGWDETHGGNVPFPPWAPFRLVLAGLLLPFCRGSSWVSITRSTSPGRSKSGLYAYHLLGYSGSRVGLCASTEAWCPSWRGSGGLRKLRRPPLCSGRASVRGWEELKHGGNVPFPPGAPFRLSSTRLPCTITVGVLCVALLIEPSSRGRSESGLQHRGTEVPPWTPSLQSRGLTASLSEPLVGVRY